MSLPPFEQDPPNYPGKILALQARVNELEAKLSEPRNESEILRMWGEFRRELRSILHNKGIPSNPGWTERDILDAFRKALAISSSPVSPPPREILERKAMAVVVKYAEGAYWEHALTLIHNGEGLAEMITNVLEGKDP